MLLSIISITHDCSLPLYCTVCTQFCSSDTPQYSSKYAPKNSSNYHPKCNVKSFCSVPPCILSTTCPSTPWVQYTSSLGASRSISELSDKRSSMVKSQSWLHRWNGVQLHLEALATNLHRNRWLNENQESTWECRRQAWEYLGTKAINLGAPHIAVAQSAKIDIFFGKAAVALGNHSYYLLWNCF